LQLKV